MFPHWVDAIVLGLLLILRYQSSRCWGWLFHASLLYTLLIVKSCHFDITFHILFSPRELYRLPAFRLSLPLTFYDGCLRLGYYHHVPQWHFASYQYRVWDYYLFSPRIQAVTAFSWHIFLHLLAYFHIRLFTNRFISASHAALPLHAAYLGFSLE